MNKRQLTIGLLLGAFIMTSLSTGHASDRGRRYKVTFTNMTRGQIVSPPIVFSHTRNFKFFEVGNQASDGLAQVAEDGMTDTLEAELLAKRSVYSVVTAGGGIPPGQSAYVEIETRRPFGFISAAGMLVVSNDAFFGARELRLPYGYGKVAYYAAAYDSGSEANSESCDYIPGPPCASPEARDTDDAEGFIHIHSGIHGIGDLAPEQFDWRNPVVKITIQAVR